MTALETTETKTTNELKALIEEHFQLLKPHKTNMGKFSVKNLQVDGYQDLFFTLRSLINVCIMALENRSFSNRPIINEPEVHVQTVLELVVKLIPFEEGEFLDKVEKMILQNKG